MTRARAMVAAVPQRVWTAAAGLALLASLAVAAVIGAGLSVWRSAVGSTAQPPTAAIEPPGSGLVVLPGTPGHRPSVPAKHVPAPIAPPNATGSGSAPAQPEANQTVVTPPAPAATTPAARTTGTPLVFIPHLLTAAFTTNGNGNGDDDAVGAGGSIAHVEQVGEAALHGQAQAHVAHVRHEARVEAKRHDAKHHDAQRHDGKRHDAKHAKSGGRHAAGKKHHQHRH